jgi:hypothetical protein
MAVIRPFLGFVVVVLLTISLVAGNAVVAVDRTAANEEFVTTTLEEEGAYGTIQSMASDQAASQVEEADVPVQIDTRKVINDTLTRSYLKNQTETNVNRTFRYLEDDTDELNISVHLAPLKENVADTVGDRIEDQSVGELLDIVTESEDLSTEIAGVQIDLRVVANMSEGPEAYQRERESFRRDIREAAINQTFEERSNDELLELVGEDPDQYNESEKEEIVNEREDEIKQELRNESAEEIDSRVDERLADINDQINENVATTVESNLADSEYEPVAEPATDLLVVGVEGLTTDKSYEEFDAELSAAKADLAENVSIVVQNRLDEQVNDRFNLLRSDEIDDDAQANIRDSAREAKEGYGRLNLLSVLLPLAALGLIGALYLITRSPPTTAVLSGVPMAFVGSVTYVVAAIAPDKIESQVTSELPSEDLPAGTVDLLLGIVEQTLGVVASQSLLLALLGVGLVVGGVAVRVRDS